MPVNNHPTLTILAVFYKQIFIFLAIWERAKSVKNKMQRSNQFEQQIQSFFVFVNFLNKFLKKSVPPPSLKFQQ